MQDNWETYCNDIFGALEWPHVTKTNAIYGGLDISGWNIFFVNAIEDPWQWAGMRELTYPDSLHKSDVAALIDCDDCGHCIDFHTPYEGQPEALTAVQEQIADVVGQWIADASPSSTVQITE